MKESLKPGIETGDTSSDKIRQYPNFMHGPIIVTHKQNTALDDH